MNEELILVLSEHRFFGWKFNIYSAQLLASGSLQLLGTPHAASEKGVSEKELKLIKLVEEVSDKALMKAYSKKNSSVEFKNDISKETFENIIRPRIDSNIRAVIELAKQTDLPVFVREDLSSKTLYQRYRIHILPSPTRCLFNFVKDEKGLIYFISLTNEDQSVALRIKPAIVVVRKPGVVLLGNQLHRIPDIDAIRLTPFFEKEYIAVPRESEKMYIQDFVLKTMDRHDVKVEGIPLFHKKAEFSPILSLEEDFNGITMLSLAFWYDDKKILPGNKKKKFFNSEEKDSEIILYCLERDIERETRLIDKLLNKGLKTTNRNFFYLTEEVRNRNDVIEWLNDNADELLCDFQLKQSLDRLYYMGKIELHSSFHRKIDWFDIDIAVVAGGFKIPFTRFRKHILSGDKEFILPDKSIMILPDEWFERYRDLFSLGREEGDKVRLSKIHIGLLKDTVGTGLTEKDKVALDNLLQIPKTYPSLPLQPGVTLRPYQKEGFYWLEHLYEHRLGGCLADDMGLGKTLQTITLLRYVYETSKQQPSVSSDGQLSLFDSFSSGLPASLIIVPTSLIHNWKNEIMRFAPQLKWYIYAGSKRLKTAQISRLFDYYQVVITSYGTVRNDIDYLSEYKYHYIILDESQLIKNPGSLLYKSVIQLQSECKLALTGTPVENSLEDLWAQFNFLNEGLLGSLSSFKKNYINPILKEQNKSREIRLKQLIKPFILRRTKEEVTPELPPLLEEVIYCDMSDEQQIVYNAEKNKIRNVLLEMKEKSGTENFIVLEGLNRLRQLANHPSLVFPEYTGDSGKFEQIILFFETLKARKHKVLIFSSYVKHLLLLARKFEEEHWKYALLTGETTKREDEINRFINDPDIHCFFISLKAGGTGINLTAADYVFVIDPWWNPAAEMQALARAHRIGQEKKVIAYRFISVETIEEKIVYLQHKKNELSELFVNSNNPLKNMDLREVEDLFF